MRNFFAFVVVATLLIGCKPVEKKRPRTAVDVKAPAITPEAVALWENDVVAQASVDRIPVVGGWLYITTTFRGTASTFVPDAAVTVK